MWPTHLLQKLRLRQCIVTARPWRMRRHEETVRSWRVARRIAVAKFWRSRLYQCGLQYCCQSQPIPQWHVATAITCQNHLFLSKLVHVFSHLEVFNVIWNLLHMKLTVCCTTESLLGLEMWVDEGVFHLPHRLQSAGVLCPVSRMQVRCSLSVGK